MKEKRARNIAKVLGDAQKWHSHGRGITMKELTSEAINLKIDDFGKDKAISDVIRHWHELCVDYYSTKSGFTDYIHSSKGIRRVR